MTPSFPAVTRKVLAALRRPLHPGARERLRGAHRVGIITTDSFVTKEIIDRYEIGPGDEVFIVGRFVNHEGKVRNLPSVRFGNIAQMPWEPIVIDGHEQESFIVEGRSISGYSGAPVYVTVESHFKSTMPDSLRQSIKEGKLELPGVSRKRVDVLLRARRGYVRPEIAYDCGGGGIGTQCDTV